MSYLVAVTDTLVAAMAIQTAILTVRITAVAQTAMVGELHTEELAAMVEALVVTRCLT